MPGIYNSIEQDRGLQGNELLDGNKQEPASSFNPLDQPTSPLVSTTLVEELPAPPLPIPENLIRS